MKKTISKLLVLSMVSTMALGGMTTASAANKIQINNNSATTGVSIDGVTYNIYSIFDANNEINTNFEEFFTTGAFSSLYGVKNPGLAIAVSDIIVEYEAEQMAKLASDLQTYVVGKGFDPTTTMTGSKGEKGESAVSGELTGNYYLVLDSRSGSDIDISDAATAPIIRYLDGTTAEDSDNTNHITIKASAPTVDKDVWHNDEGEYEKVADHQIGDTVEFKVSANLPLASAVEFYDTYTYTLTDVMSDGLTYTDGSLKVSYNSTPLDTEYYTPTINEDKSGFTLDVKIKEWYEDLNGAAPAALDLTYSAVLNNKAVTANDADTNTITLEYSNDPNDLDSKGTINEEVVVYNFSLDIVKQNEAGTHLGGVEFELYDGENIMNLVFVGAEEAGGKGYYRVATSEDLVTTTTIITDDNGILNVYGLDDAKTYTLKETKTVEGYELLTEDIEFTINASYDNSYNPTLTLTVPTVTGVTNSSDGSDLAINVVNFINRLLPETGGVGTVMFYVVGGMTMAGAAGLAIVKTKKAKA